MKKVFALLLALTVVFISGAIGASAETVYPEVDNMPEEGIYYFEDGSYIVTEDVTPDVQPLSVSRKVKSRLSTYYNSDNVAQCALQVNGTFEVDYGVSVKCGAVSADFYVYVDGWSIEDVTKTSSSGAGDTATATASGVFIKKKLFITTSRVPVSITASCTKNG